MFTQINYNENLGNIVARVNRRTGELQVNPNIWKYLNEKEKKFVIFHEKGHLKLDTRSEFEANNYARKEYIKSAVIRDSKDFEREIVFLTQISKKSDWSNFDPVTAVAGAVDSIFGFLSISGIGSKARRQEMQEQAKAQIGVINAQGKILDAQAKRRTELIIISFVLILVIVVMILVFRKAKR